MTNEKSMIEKLTLAICEIKGQDPDLPPGLQTLDNDLPPCRKINRPIAVKVLRTLKNPTTEMIENGESQFNNGNNNIEDVFKAMIDAELNKEFEDEEKDIVDQEETY